MLHIILHETGHLIAGKMSGYKFLSFRILMFTLIKKDGKYSWKKFGFPGAYGQCIMIPPEPDENGEIPYLFYNIGGGLINIIFTGIAIALLIVLDIHIFIGFTLSSFILIGLYLSIINLVPVKSLSNDGHNIKIMRNDAYTRRCFRLILLLTAYTTMGVRAKDMPPEWAEYEGEISDVTTISVTPLIIKLAILADNHKFEEARELAGKIIKEAKNMMDVQKNELIIELMFLEIITERREEEINKLYTEDIKKYITQTPFLITRHRFTYAYAKLISLDETEAEKALEKFNKYCLSYPFAGEIETEKELIEIINRKAEEITA
jgi:hypothetical protein